MSIIAIVGSAIASTLLSKVFSNATQKKDQPPDKTMFELMVDQFSPAQKAEGANQTAAACSTTPDGGVSGKILKPESTGGAAGLEAQFTQPRVSRSSGESAGNSLQDVSLSANSEAGAKQDGKASLDDLLASLEAEEANATLVASILQRAAQLRSSYGVDATQSASNRSISTNA